MLVKMAEMSSLSGKKTKNNRDWILVYTGSYKTFWLCCEPTYRIILGTDCRPDVSLECKYVLYIITNLYRIESGNPSKASCYGREIIKQAQPPITFTSCSTTIWWCQC